MLPDVRTPRPRPRLHVHVVALILLATAGMARGQVVLNEVLASNRLTNLDEDLDSSDWLELYNPGAAAVDLTGYSLTDDRGDLGRWVFPDATLAPDSYLLVWCSGKDRTAVPTERIVERNSPFPFTPTFISLDDEWRYLTGAPGAVGPSPDWVAPEFDDATWKRGKPGFGFGRDDEIQTELPEGLATIFVRRRFDYQPGARNLVLEIRYDDGFVAYLNGIRVASDKFPEDVDPVFTSEATGSHSARNVERVDLTPFLDLLQPGENVLAMVVLNSRPTSNDLLLFPELGTVPSVFHTNFKVSSSGDSVLLVNPAGSIVDEVDLPSQSADQSFARSPNGTGPFLYHLTPTPLARNEGPASDQPLFVADTRFSQDRGFYDAPIDVEIATATEGAVIRYTLDGSLPTESNGTVYEAPIRIEATTTLRARAFKPGHASSNADTQTYIFLRDVVLQSPNGRAPPGWPSRSVNGQVFNYGMDPNIVDREPWTSQLEAALTQIPSISLTTGLAHLVDPQTGIYVHAGSDGRVWERPTSIELINPDGTPGFQLDAGLRIRGGFSRGGFNPKHSFRLFFRSEYGKGKLRFPLFEDEGVDEFDSVDLRTAQNYAWSNDTFNDQLRNTFLRDVFTRDLQREQGRPYTRSRYYHLYLNGQYWGLYQTQERSEASYAESYFGPEKEDYDAIKASGGNVQATDGNMDAWNELMVLSRGGFASNESYFAVQGRNPDGTDNPELPVHVDTDSLIDFMLNVFFTGNRDMPVSLGGGGPNNFWTIRNRTDRKGWRWFAHDNEHNMLSATENKVNDDSALNNPKYVHQQLDANEEYRLRFADRAHRFLFNGGAGTTERAQALLQTRVDQIDMAIIAESARWGDQHNEPPLTKDTWAKEVDWLMNAFLGARRDVLLEQLRARNLYPPEDLAAPAFSQNGGIVPRGFNALPRIPGGVLYYTTDGTDPRLLGGEIAGSALTADSGEHATLLSEGASVRVHVPSSDALGLDWTETDFDDSGWLEGQAGVGFDRRSGYEEFIATDVEEMMYEVNASVYIRVAFDVDESSPLEFLTLRMRYDDGYVAYLNGVRVAERRVPEDLSWNSRSRGTHADSAAILFESVELGAPEEILRQGRNVLAIHGLNSRESDSDFLMEPMLTAVDPTGSGIVIERTTQLRTRTWVDGEWSALNEANFIVDGNIPFRVTEIMYHPPESPQASRYDREEFEFVEFQNIGAETLDLSEIRVSGGIEFDFASSDVETLAPGAHVILVENLAAFGTLHNTNALNIAGQYTGKLGNAGDRLIVEGFLGEPILDFEYDDEWHPETDGDGRSLVIVDRLAARESWSDGANWRASDRSGGSPGVDESDPGDPGGLQRVGDASQDGGLNLTDVVILLQVLFVERPESLPCGGASLDSDGNRTLFDFDGDASVRLNDAISILNHLFLDGAPPALGTDCVRIVDCPDVCVR